MQGAGAYLIGDRVCMHTKSYTVAGFGIAVEPVICVDDLSRAEDLGLALDQVLAASRKGVPNPDFTHGAMKGFDFFLKAARVRSWRALVSSAKYVSIVKDGATVHFVPSRSDGKSFEGLPKELYITIEAPDAAQLGAALLEAFGRCE